MNRAQTASEGFRQKKTMSSTGFKFRPSTQQINRDVHYKDSLSNNEVIEINPDHIIFYNIRKQIPQQKQVIVRNLTKIPRRIRITQPTTAPARFRVDYDMQGSLAAGLSMILVVYFECTVVEDYFDVFVITSEDGFKFNVKLSALKPQPFIEFDTFLDLGYCQINKCKEGKIRFKNVPIEEEDKKKKKGEKERDSEIEKELTAEITLKNDKLTFEPRHTFLVKPDETVEITVKYQTNQASIFRQSIQVIKHWNNSIDTIEVSCIAVDYSIFFIDQNQAQSTTIDFQDLVMGYPKQYSGSLVNNTPVKQNWKVLIKKGFHTMTSSVGGFQTPNEVGLEWLEKVIRVTPEKGSMEPYAQMPIKIECKGPVTEEGKMRCENYAFQDKTNDNLKYEAPIDFGYSLFFEFFGEKNEETLIVHAQGKHIRPQVKVNKQALAFGECQVNDTRDAILVIENTHKNQTIDVTFSKAPQFLVSPLQYQLGPQMKRQFIVTFAPKNVGRVNSSLNVLLVDSQYPVKIQLSGHANFNPEKRPVTRGPEALPKDFDLDRQFVDEKQLQYIEMRRREIKSEMQPKRSTNYIGQLFEDESEQSLHQQQQRMQGMSEYEQERYAEKLQQFYQTRQNQDKYNEYLKSERQSRLQKKRDKILNMRVESMQMELKQKFSSTEDDKPIDVEFKLGIMGRETDENDPELPEYCDGLFVTKPIDKYEPFTNQKKLFQPDPLQPMRKAFPQEAQTHKEKREVAMELTGEELKKIQAGPVEIDFGNVFVKSEIARTFHIKNDLRTSISCQIITEEPELEKSYTKIQIIPSSDTGRFKIVLKSDKLGSFSRRVTYVINGKHRFEFNVKAEIQNVKIELSIQKIDFGFREENMSLETGEIVRLTNNGNATAFFQWLVSEQKVFTVNIEKGEILSGKYIDVLIIYKPSNYIIKEDKPQPIQGKTNYSVSINNQTRLDEDKLILQTKDGLDQSIKVVGQVSDARCNIKHSIVDMKELLVCKTEIKYFTIRNVSRVNAFFSIMTEKLPAACDISPSSGKIGPDETKDITVKYMSKEQTDIKTDIQIIIRGGRILKIPFLVKTIIPQVEIVQDQFDFGKLTTLGNEGSLKMTLVNNSSISAELLLNLDKDSPEAPNGIECLQVIPVDDLDKSVLKSIHEDENTIKQVADKKSEEDELASEAISSADEDELEQKIKSKSYILTIQGNSKLEFYLKFSPRDVQTYTFDLPLTLNRYGRLLSLTRQIICRGLKPRFVMDPQCVEFPRKIITSLEKCFAATVEITLSNPERKPVYWRMDVTSITTDKIFNITPIEGKIDSGQTVKVKASFNPQKADDYQKNIPVYIDSQESCYLELILKGKAAQPKILFDRREVLLPPVPLNIESKCSFKILNDGYENLNLRHKVFGEEGNINVKLRFPEGVSVGMSKKRLRVDALFQSQKSVSFTTKIEFYDEMGKVYTIPVSGTADNCLLTSFSYQQRCANEFKIDEKISQGQTSQGPICLMDDDDDANSDIQSPHKKGAPSVISYRSLSSMSNQTTASALGYIPIPQDLVEQNKQYATKWLKFFLWSANIHAFPEGVIEQDGQPIFELTSVLSGKSLPLPCQSYLDKNAKKQERITQLLKQYDDFIRMLKSEGALLNHIRPYHLLSFSDLNAAFKLLPEEEKEQVHPSVLKITQQRYNYISIDSWCAVFHQILKIYGLQRINIKYYRQIPGWGDKPLPDCYINGSNIYSPQEGLLMRWLEVCAESEGHQLPRLKYFEQLKDCHYFAAALQHYVGPSLTKYLSGLKVCETVQDFKINSNKVLAALMDMKFSIPFELGNFAEPSGREMLILVLHLFNQLPNYLNKGTEVFSCVLGQSISRTLLIINKNNRPVSYWVKLEKEEDFKLEGGDHIKLEPNQHLPYKIKFVSRISQPVTDRITFMPKREHNLFTAAIVYDLKSQILGRESKSVEEVSSPLYESKDFYLQISNEFTKSEFGNFQIKMLFEKVIETNKRKPIQNNNNKSQQIEQQKEVFPAIFCQSEIVKMKKGSQLQLQLRYVPMVLEQQRCFLIFTDPNVGEFQHEILATAELPEIQQEVKQYQVFVDQPAIMEYMILPKNEQIFKARESILNYTSKKSLPLPGGEPETINFDIELSNHFGFLTAPKQFTVQDLQKQKANRVQREKLEKQQQLEKDKQMQALQQQQPQQSQLQQGTRQNTEIKNISMISNITANPNNVTANISMLPDVNKMPLQFLFKNPVKDMPIIMTLRSNDKTDVRRYKFLVTALPKPTKAQMEMKCPSRESIVQDIPFSNPSDKDWTFKFLLNQEGNCFSLLNVPTAQPDHGHSSIFIGGYKDLVLKKKTKIDIKLQFTPKWMCKVEAHLQITNVNTNDIYDYTITGIGEEPLAQSNIVLQCKARQKTKTEIILNNYSQNEMKYKVETDLINASGLQNFTIAPQRKYRYELSVMPMLSGQYNGSITFYEESGEYIWYTVVLDTDSPIAEKEVEISTQVRKPVSFEIELSNPMPFEQATFEVRIEGDNLHGSKTFTILPQMSSIYELYYLPLLPEKKKGVIGFIHPKLGEIWYNLSLISEERQSIRIPTLKTELGKVEEYEIQLENPIDKEVNVQIQISNPANFDVLPTDIVLKPHCDTSVYIRFTPSSLDQIQNGEIRFITQEIGKWEYLVYGVGIPPTAFPEMTVTVGINKDYSDVIHFKNPFRDTIQVQIMIESDDDAFQLLIKKKNDTKTTIAGLQQIQIPFSFTPRSIRSYRCELVVAMNEKIKWRYPIIGHTESFATGKFTQFKTKCRISFLQEFKFSLPGVDKIGKSNFTFEIKNISEDVKMLVDKFFKIKMIQSSADDCDEVHFDAAFIPLKPFKANFDLIIKRDIGGVWKFPMNLDATEPDIDDLIIITSPLNKPTSVSFRITNRTKHQATFRAYFTPSSDQEFSVTPKYGELQPNGREGTQFIITFTPLEYGQIRSGKLIIETDDMYWSYKVRGTLPKYEPPVAQPKVDAKLIANNSSNFKPKNFLQNNIKRNHSPPSIHQKSTAITNLNFSRRTFGATLTRETKSVQLMKTQKLE
ncbi:unnamed protein product [Paramecium primaurelia]|uniref:Calponin-homology (CH) domain-containing protein n=1 Tax=Paramecium primaurelia TaxID=5886 RepID=A0A8S1NL54_PARPR|nr:unnamed protein product [Paramecium primaurelia]